MAAERAAAPLLSPGLAAPLAMVPSTENQLVPKEVHRIYRGGGGSFQKAQDEWQTGSWRDPPSREAQFSNFSGSSLPEYPTVPNYPPGGRWP